MLAVTLLAIVTAMIMGAIGSMVMAQVRQHHQLGAAELANRLVLQYLDDKRSLPAAGLPIVYGRDKYRWDYSEQPITLTSAKPEANTNRNTGALSLNRLKAVVFRAWLAEESGGSAFFDGGAPAFSIARIVDPIALRNPDSIDYMLKNPEAYKEFLANFTGATSPGVQPSPTPLPQTDKRGSQGKTPSSPGLPRKGGG